ncbi:MAG: hypothetical protein HYR55_06800 [Acidobacteria bacterium]|nr:hypothetical protein [Acidobacteriota bacterium]MBI3655823.1 hypothetical protein [Acidobacteriota bacterium]
MLKKMVLYCLLILCLSVGLSAQDKGDPNGVIHPDGAATPDDVVTLSGFGISVSVNSFGRAGHASAGCAGIGQGFKIHETQSQLCEHTDFISTTGGRPVTIDSPACTIIERITLENPESPMYASSALACGDCLVHFEQIIDPDAGWVTNVGISGCRPGCYYSYTDYDVNGFGNNGGSWHAREEGGLGQFVIRNNVTSPDVHYLFTDLSNATRWQQGEYPTVRNLILGFSGCGDLSNAPALFNGDWTGALQYGFTGSPSSFSYRHGRDNTVIFP